MKNKFWFIGLIAALFLLGGSMAMTLTASSASDTGTARIAAPTAPQLSCPSTTMSFVSRCATAYSMLAMLDVLATLPATRTTNRSPSPVSNAISGATRLSAHVDTAAKGFVILLAATVATLVMRRASASARHLVWSLSVVGLLLLPVVSAVLPGWQVLPN